MLPVVGLRLIGYWRNESADSRWPDPREFVDHGWPQSTRNLIVACLVRGRTLEQYRGLSPCRFCDHHNGSKELTDGTYCWPEGLAHYLAVHDVRLPEEFVTHVASSAEAFEPLPWPEFDDLGQRLRGGGYDDEWNSWTTAQGERFRSGEWTDTTSPNWLNADISAKWWLAHASWSPKQDA